jgi:hypothetical protein
MKNGILHLGTYTKFDSIKNMRKVNREVELQNSIGFISTHKVHKSSKNYTRKIKHKNEVF